MRSCVQANRKLNGHFVCERDILLPSQGEVVTKHLPLGLDLSQTAVREATENQAHGSASYLCSQSATVARHGKRKFRKPIRR